MQNGPKLLTLAARIYRLLLHAYPVPFRRQYGQEMAQVFRDDTRQTLRQRGVSALAGLWLLTFIDLLKTALAEHIWEVFHMPMEKLQRWSGPAAAIAGILWASPIEVEGNLGFLLYVPVLLFMAVGLAGLYQRFPASLRLESRLAFGTALMGLLLMLAVALGPSFITGFDDFFFNTLWALLVVFLTVIAGFGGMGVIAISTRALGRLSFVPLAQAAIFLGIFLAMSESPDPLQTTFLVLFGISWVLLGFALWSRRKDTSGPTQFA